ncbi:hypothetical protein AGMMS50229_15160 [Campylobacterota bacterium]|nr:hypothetical protein AGMMS50229_15160 [Campylobacterota bacterium]
MKGGEAKQRERYAREVERFLHRILAASRSLDWAALTALSQDRAAKLAKQNAPAFYSPYYQQMISLANNLTQKTTNETGNSTELGEWLSHELNLLEKSRRQSTYKRTKATSNIEEYQ